MNEITLLAKSGLGWQGIGGIILLLTGIGLIYFGIKALQGYRFFPEQEYNIPEEDHYEPTQAKALQKIGLAVPQITRVCMQLREQGIPLSDDIYTVEAAYQQILQLYRQQKEGTEC